MTLGVGDEQNRWEKNGKRLRGGPCNSGSDPRTHSVSCQTTPLTYPVGARRVLKGVGMFDGHAVDSDVL